MDRLIKCSANYSALSPLTFLKRAATVYPDHLSIIYEETRFTWKETYERCRCLASSLKFLNVVKNDVVSVLAPNVPALLEMHFAVPMAGAVLNTINTRLDANNVATILRHSEAKLFFVDHHYVPLARSALNCLMGDSKAGHVANVTMPLVIVIADGVDAMATGIPLGQLEYEQLIKDGDPRLQLPVLQDELDSIALNYTSGTTSAPKGVVYSHRGTYLSTLSLILQWGMGSEPVFLWTLPMFHCNGWTFTWGVAARGGTNVCIRSPASSNIYGAIAKHCVTHMCCAPIIFNMIIDTRSTERCPIASPVQVLTGGAPPPAALLEKMEGLGFHVTHAYGLTEATGPALVCEWKSQWDNLCQTDQAKLKARQGISVLSLADADVKDPVSMNSVARDGVTMGEIVLRGSSIMKGYYRDPAATSLAFQGGWFHTGDVGVVHPDGYVEIKDRSKDIIISGGENISSVEVEAVLYTHPLVLEAAVVAMRHQLWGETPCAFITLKGQPSAPGVKTDVSQEDIISYCRKNMSHFMVPKKVIFVEELPKTSTGKIKKFQLRALAKELANSDKTQKSNPKAQHSNSHGTRQFEPQEHQVLAMSCL
ncbi:hypothetical protein MRB53_022673 [Persea americana]|uniref:Uncharacterized protein n=1 Tax=Persea americana TaxID=3435 RepID=A0ACC2L7N8_PERAE|nr:hypothetical protein MRB53_022673 [Persea americana]